MFSDTRCHYYLFFIRCIILKNCTMLKIIQESLSRLKTEIGDMKRNIILHYPVSGPNNK